MPWVLLIAGLGLIGGLGYVTNQANQTVRSPAVTALGIGAALYAAHLIIKDLR